MKIKKRFGKLSAVVDNQSSQDVRPITIGELVKLNNDPKFLDALEKARKADPELCNGETAITALIRKNNHASRNAERESKKMSSLIGLDGHNLTY